jgi:hypothetical protein
MLSPLSLGMDLNRGLKVTTILKHRGLPCKKKHFLGLNFERTITHGGLVIDPLVKVSLFIFLGIGN